MATAMSVQDALWLTMDRPNNLMVVDGAMVLREQVSLREVQDVMLAVTDRHPVFRRRPERRGQSWLWVDDPDFDIAHHVVEVPLDRSADVATLQRFVGEQRSRPLDKSRALWGAWLLPRLVLDDGTVGCAVVMRFHHAIADGVRVTQLMLSTCEVAEGTVVPTVVRTSPGDGTIDPVALVTEGTEEAARVSANAARAAATAVTRLAAEIAGSVGEAVSATGQAVADPVGSITAAPAAVAALPVKAAGVVGDLVRVGAEGVEDGIDLVRRPDRLVDALQALGVEDHRSVNDISSVTKLLFTDSGRTVWTGEPGAAKVVTWSRPLPLADIKRVGRAHGATVNDVLLAAVSGGLRRYLAAHDESLDEVVWMVPVNLKPFEDNLPEELGNYFALVMLPMSLADGTYEDRLGDMHNRMSRIKNSDEAVLTFGLQRAVSMSPSAVAFFLTNFFANKAVGVLTNVPGPTGLLTFAGAPVEQIVGFAPCSGNQPMTATIFSYNGTVTIGFASDATLVPDPETLAALVVDEVEAMTSAIDQD